MQIDQHVRNEFQKTGIVHLRALISARKTQLLKTHILEELARKRLVVNGKWQTKKFDGTSPFQLSNRISQSLKPFPDYNQIIPAEMCAVLLDIAGSELDLAGTPPQFLVTPPQKEDWELPSTGWHVDISIRDRIPGIQIFILLDRLDSRGGATLAIAGSHLNRKARPEERVVVEMCGGAGDVFVMDMRVLHAPSINSRRNARLMLTCRYMAK